MSAARRLCSYKSRPQVAATSRERRSRSWMGCDAWAMRCRSANFPLQLFDWNSISSLRDFFLSFHGLPVDGLQPVALDLVIKPKPDSQSLSRRPRASSCSVRVTAQTGNTSLTNFLIRAQRADPLEASRWLPLGEDKIEGHRARSGLFAIALSVSVRRALRRQAAFSGSLEARISS